jgi:hypothetical protein
MELPGEAAVEQVVASEAASAEGWLEDVDSAVDMDLAWALALEPTSLPLNGISNDSWKPWKGNSK